MFVSRPAHPTARGEHPMLVGHPLRRALRLLLALALTLGSLPLQLSSVAFAAGIVVTTTADTIDAAGSCATVTLASLPGPDGQTSLREALCAAQTNAGPDSITFSVNGTFAITLNPGPDENSGATGDFDILTDVTITGNGSANTIIDGQDLDRVFDLDPFGNCNAATSCTIALSGMTIRNGRATTTTGSVGGAVFIGSRAIVSITNSVIESSSSATSSGGGIQAGGALTLTNVTVQDNVAVSNGGGVNGISNLTINNSTFLNNQAEFGGGLSLVQNSTRTVTISNSTFSGNRSVITAGGVNDDGGAIYANTDTTITITGSTFSANTSVNDGGGLFLQDSATAGIGTFSLTNNTISGNRADANGGGIYIVSGNATITNVTVTQNHSDNNNGGGEVGGGLRVAGGSVTLNNTIVAENYRGSGATTTDNVNGTIGGSNNLTSGSPLLGALANNGGPTQTHALLAGSPAINTGNDAVCPTTDQRGITRAGNGVCDIGAYELSDTTPPDTTITGNPTNPSNSTSATFTFSGSDNFTPAGSLTFQCQLDSGGFSACTSPRTYTGLADGSHTFQVRAIDGSLNVDPTPATYTWIVDATAPNTTITANPTNPSASTSAGFSFTGNDGSGTGVASFQCQLDGGGFSACTSPQTYTGLSQGSHTFQVRAVDAVGNADSTPASFTWVIDTTQPDTTITANPTNPSGSANASFSFTGSDPGGSGVAGFECQIDGGAFIACTSPQTYTGLSDGSHTFQVRAVDAAGNIDGTPASFTWVVDATGPDTTITANPTNPSASANASFSFTGNDGGGTGVAGFECQIDGGAFSACASPRTYTGLSDGSHTFQVRAVDAAGNADSTPASFTWVIDTTPPPAPVVITPANGASTNNTQPSISGTAEANSTVTVFLDGTAAGTTTADAVGNWTFTPPTLLSDGSHTARARATDAVGNTSVDSNTNTFTVDTTPPPAPVVSTPANGSSTNNAQPPIGGTAETNSTVTVFLDGVAAGTTTADAAGAWTFTPPSALSDGSHTARARATDAAGNTSVDSNTNTFTVDTTGPDTTITANPTNPSGSANASFSFTGSDPGGSGVAGFECQIDGGAFSACTSPQTYTGLSDGSHTFEVRALDAAGNADSTPASFTWVVDTVAPTVAFSSAAPDPTNVSPIPVTATFSEDVTGFTAADITTGNGTVSNFAGSGSVYTFDLAPSGQGLVTADIAAGVAQDAAGNGNTAATQHSRAYDSVAPTVTINQAAGQADPTGTAPISFTVVFDEPVTGFGDSAADVTITGTAGATTATVAGGGTIYSVAVSGMTGTGAVVVTIPAGAAQDLATNPSAASTSTDNSVDFDPVVPVVTGIVRADPSPTSAASVQFTVTFSKAVSGVDASDFTFAAAGVSGASVTGVTGSGTTWTVTVSTGSGDGTLRMDLVDDDTIVDAAGNKLGGSGAGNGNFTGGQVYTIDKTAPSVSAIVRAGVDPTNAASVDFTVTFSETVTGVDAADFALTAVGVSGAAVTGVSGSATTWTVTASTGSGSGTIRLDVVDDDSIVDVIGNQLGGAGLGNGNFTTGEVYTVDKTAPTAGNLVTAPVTPGSSVYTFQLDYTDNLAVDSSSLGNGNVRVTGPNGFDQLATFVGVSPTGNGTPRTATYQVSAPGGTWDSSDNGVYNVAIVGSQVRDIAGNAVAASPLGSFTITAGYKVYLPLIMGNPGLPDLVVDQITASSTGIQVVIRNQGSAPVSDAFWVDLYINPTTAPTRVNQIWQALGAQGAVWGVTSGALPIAPGGTLTLTVGGAYFRADLSNVPQSLAPGTRIYAQVDSANAATTYGAVLETHEQSGGAYNNIASAVVLAGLKFAPHVAISSPGAQPREWLPARRPGLE